MFSYFNKNENQKKLYFQIKQNINFYDTVASGVYAIFKEDICLYVDQSKNIASRLATHLSGKYKECDKILVFASLEDTYDKLIVTEKYVMNLLKPIENLLVDFTEKIDYKEIFESTLYYEIENPYNHHFDILESYDFILINDKNKLFVADSEIGVDLYSHLNMRQFLKSIIIQIENSIERKK